MNQIHEFLGTTLSGYGLDDRWYPFIYIGIALLILLIIFVIFSYIRSFISWILGLNEIARFQKEQTNLLREIVAIQSEQQELFEALFIENSHDNPEKNEHSKKISQEAQKNKTGEYNQGTEEISEEDEDFQDNGEIESNATHKSSKKSSWFSRKK